MRRPLLPALLAAAALGGGGLAVTACAPAHQEMTVRFTTMPGTLLPDPAQVAAARHACPGTATVRLEAPPTSKLVSVQVVPIRYDISGTDDHDVSQVQACLQKQPGVSQVATTDPTDN